MGRRALSSAKKRARARSESNKGYSWKRALQRFRVVPSGSRYWYGHLAVLLVILAVVLLSAVVRAFDTWFLPVALGALALELVLGQLDRRNPPHRGPQDKDELRVSKR